MGTIKRTPIRVKSEWIWRVLVLTCDILVFLIVVALAMVASSLISKYMTVEWWRFVELVIHTAPALFMAFYLIDFYNPRAYMSKMEIFGAVVKGSTLAVLLIAFVEFLLKKSAFTRSYAFSFWLISIPFFYLERTLIFAAVSPFKEPDRVLIIGELKDVENVIERVNHNGFGEEGVIVGVVLFGKDGNEEVKGYPVLASLSYTDSANSKACSGYSKNSNWIQTVLTIIEDQNVDRVVVASPMNYREFLEELHKELVRDVTIEIIPGIYEILIGKPDYRLIADIPLVKFTRKKPPDWYFAVKRIMDIVISIALIILTIPICIIAAVLIKVTSKGPLFYKQRRIGKDGKPYTIYKFRTMVKDAEKGIGPIMAKKNDPRITPVGKILRKYRIDELPQLFNVLKGEMTLVGPRPEREEFVRKYLQEIEFYTERLKVKPGITGLAQVWGNYSTSPKIKLIYDLIYIYNQSLLLDLEILMKTIKTVLRGSGT
ncbi:MAG: hypothetical protein DRQ10_05905 [Candidatus Hydrothermota bacterium]|nr:MAG: hypothetical protein DRQ10_05905 [Candidatus Hydrothermae bacterium]